MADKTSEPEVGVKAGRDFYTEIAPETEVRHFDTMWHTIGIGHLAKTDLNRLARRHGLSSADLLLLGALRVSGPQPLRATDLALKLHVTNASLSARVARLAGQNLLTRTHNANDRRSYEITLTPAGADKADAAILEISQTGQFARAFLRLPEEDRETVTRILGDLHDLMDRDFLPVRRGGQG